MYSTETGCKRSNSPKTGESTMKSEKSNALTTVSSQIIPVVQTKNSGKSLCAEQYLRDRWFIRGLIGQGGYGEIYLALDTKEALDVAIKTENRIRRGRTSKRMILEQKVLLQLQGKHHVPAILASGHDEQINFIVMELLSTNVSDLKKMSPIKRLSRSTTGRILIQGVAALRDIHIAGYLHRDVKPANMCFGITPASRHILFLVDFGLVRKYRNEDGTLKKPRRKPGFRGTLRYVSCRVHDRLEQVPIDDIVSLTYSGIELLLGELPWKHKSRYEDVRLAKEELLRTMGDDSSYLAVTPPSFQQFCQAVLSTEPTKYFDYTHLQSFLTDLIGEKTLRDPYDWENSFRDLEPSPTASTETSRDDKKIDPT